MNESLMSLALWLGGVGHFCALGASFQVPARLNWKAELAKLMPLNRKLMWVSCSFTVLTIISFGTLTFALHGEMLAGDRAAIGLAAFIAVFWTARLLVDVFYYRQADWPPGLGFVIGHAALFSLFVAEAVTYWCVVIRAFAL